MSKLYNRAVGYTVEEVVEEYAGGERDGELLKRKVTTKPVPPDINALKTYMELIKSRNDYENMTDDQLEAEKNRLLKELKKESE